MKTLTKKTNHKTIEEAVNEKLEIANEMLAKTDLSVIYKIHMKNRNL